MAKKKIEVDEEVKVAEENEETTAPEETQEDKKQESPELPKVEGTKTDSIIELKEDSVIFVRANRPLTPSDFNALANRVEEAAQKSGFKIVLIPYSATVDHVE